MKKNVITLLLIIAASVNATGINLVVNGDFESGNSGFNSSYIFSNNIWPEGSYAIGTNIYDHHGMVPTFDPFGDHTSGTGRMMFVNGATVPNLLAWGQSVSVAKNTDYLFEGWITQWSIAPTPPEVLPELSIRVNGNELTTIIPVVTQGVWTKFSATWNSGDLTTANLQLVDKVTLYGGNDFAIDDLKFQAVPEPATGFSLALGGLLITGYRRIRKAYGV